MKLKKIRKWIAAGIVVLVVLVVLAVIWIDRLAKAGIETGSTHALGTETTLGGADIGILSGRSELSGLNIDNPAGFDTDHFLRLDEGVLDVTLGSLTSDTVEVAEISLAGVDINLEKKGGKSNYKVIMDNLSRFESGEEAEPEQREGKKFIIRQIVIEDVKVHIDLLPIGGEATRVTVPIDELRLQNVGTGSDKGVIVAELVAVLFKAIMMSAIEKGGSVIPSDIVAELDTALKSLKSLENVGASLAVGVKETVKDLTEQGAEAAAKIGDVAKDTAQKASDTAKDTAQKAGEKAKEAADEITKGLGGLLEKKQEKDK